MAKLNPGNTWFNNSVGVTRASITQINVVDSYTPNGSEKSWSGGDGVTVYADGGVLTIAGDGGGKIYLDADSKYLFAAPKTEADRFFGNVTTLSGLNIFDASNVESLSFAFDRLSKVEAVDIHTWKTPKLKHFQQTFQLCTSLKTVDISNIDLHAVDGAEGVFMACSALENVVSDGIRLDEATSIKALFYGCEKLKKSPKISGLAKCTDMSSVYTSCKIMEAPDFSEWDTSSCKTMVQFLYGACHYKTLDFSSFDTSNVETFDHFAARSYFYGTGYENWNTSKCTNFNALFHTWRNKVLDISKLDFSAATVATQLFDTCANVKKIIGIEKLALGNSVDFSEMFALCGSLEELDISALDTRKAKDGTQVGANGVLSATMMNMFSEMTRLRKLTVGPNFSWDGDGTTTDPTHHAILPTPAEPDIPGADGKWYDIGGNAYAPDAMPQTTAGTYYASKQIAGEEDVMLKNRTLLNTADAIRAKGAMLAPTAPSEFPKAIKSISQAAGSGWVTVEQTTIQSDAKQFTRSKTPDGRPYGFKQLLVMAIFNGSAKEKTDLRMTVNNDSAVSGYCSANPGEPFQWKNTIDTRKGIFESLNVAGNNKYLPGRVESNNPYYSGVDILTQFTISASRGNIPAGTEITIKAVR